MGHRPFPDADRALRHLGRRHFIDDVLRVQDPVLPEARFAAACVTGEPVPGLPLPVDDWEEVEP